MVAVGKNVRFRPFRLFLDGLYFYAHHFSPRRRPLCKLAGKGFQTGYKMRPRRGPCLPLTREVARRKPRRRECTYQRSRGLTALRKALSCWRGWPRRGRVWRGPGRFYRTARKNDRPHIRHAKRRDTFSPGRRLCSVPAGFYVDFYRSGNAAKRARRASPLHAKSRLRPAPHPAPSGPPSPRGRHFSEERKERPGWGALSLLLATIYIYPFFSRNARYQAWTCSAWLSA